MNRHAQVSVHLSIICVLAGCGHDAGFVLDRYAALEPPARCETAAFTERELVHLTRAQYDNTVRDLLGLSGEHSRDFPGDRTTDGYEVGSNTSSSLVNAYFDRAGTLAEEATRDLDTLLDCDRSAFGDDVCVRAFLGGFLPRAMRRPLFSGELDRYYDLYAQQRTSAETSVAVQRTLHAVLASPSFIYHDEPIAARNAPEGSLVRASSHVVANRLAYALWNTMPDRELFAVANADGLTTPEQVREVAVRMMLDPRAVDGMRNFYRQWLQVDGLEELEKDPEVMPNFSTEVASSLRISLEAFMDEALWDVDGRLDTVLRGSHAYVNASIADVYGMSNFTAAGFQRHSFEATERPGVLTHPAVLARFSHEQQTSPVLRGLFVRRQFLCVEPPPPPPELQFDIGDEGPASSARDRVLERISNPTCRPCHQLMDAMGIGLENYDAVGRYRTHEDGQAVYTAGELIETDIDGTFNGAVELTDRLATSEQVQQCVSRQLFRYVNGRRERESESCIMDDLFASGAQSDWRLPAMMLDIAESYPILHQYVPEGSVP